MGQLEKQRRFANAGVTANQYERSGHNTAAQHTVRLCHARRKSLFLLRGNLYNLLYLRTRGERHRRMRRFGFLLFQFFDIAGILAYTTAFMLVVLAFEYGVLRPLEKHLLQWRPDPA